MKLSINLFSTLDGVSQGPGSPDEDTRNGFTRGGWLMPVFDQGCGEVVSGWFERCGALLLGRTTYDTFASHWPNVTDPDDLVAERINEGQKFVVTSRPLGSTWASTSTVLHEDVLTEISELKARESDLELQVHGSIRLARALHEANLVDVYRFLIAPVVVGSGARLFDESGPALSMHVEHSRFTENGVLAIEMTPKPFTNTLKADVRDGRDVIADA